MKGKTCKQRITCLTALLLTGALALQGCALSEFSKKQVEEVDALWKSETESEVSVETEAAKTIGGAETETEEPAAETESVSEALTEDLSKQRAEALMETLQTDWFTEEEAQGASWSAAYEDLTTGAKAGYMENRSMLSASVIKVFIMGAVYEQVIEAPEGEGVSYTESYEGELNSLLSSMITVSDNDAANRLTEILGSGSFDAGAQIVNAFCEAHGFAATHLGRRFLGSNAEDDNYTSAADCRQILEEIYKGTLVSADASEAMLTLLKGQTRKNKIPSGLSEGISSANKTGEMPEGYGLGCIENDMAIVFTPYGDYILTVLSGDLGGRNSEAITKIGSISSEVLQFYLSDSLDGG